MYIYLNIHLNSMEYIVRIIHIWIEYELKCIYNTENKCHIMVSFIVSPCFLCSTTVCTFPDFLNKVNNKLSSLKIIISSRSSWF